MKIYLINEFEALEGRDPRKEIIGAYASLSEADAHIGAVPASPYYWSEIEEIELFNIKAIPR